MTRLAKVQPGHHLSNRDIKNVLACRCCNNKGYMLLNEAESDNECVLVEILKCC